MKASLLRLATQSLPVLMIPAAFNAGAAEFESSIGLGGAWKQEHIKGEAHNTRLLPYINVEYNTFKASPDGIGSQVKATPSDQFGVFLKYREASFDHSDNRVLRHLDERDDATEAALQWVHTGAHFDVTSSAAFDISNTHEGYEAKVKLSKQMPSKVGMFIPSASVAYQSDDLVNYYYGVSSAEATRATPAYQADGTINASVGVTHILPITEHWHTSTHIGYHHLGSEIADSSIVKRSDYWAARLVVFYKF